MTKEEKRMTEFKKEMTKRNECDAHFWALGLDHTRETQEIIDTF